MKALQAYTAAKIALDHAASLAEAEGALFTLAMFEALKNYHTASDAFTAEIERENSFYYKNARKEFIKSSIEGR